MTYSLLLSIYASLIATSVLFWQIYTFVSDRKGKLNVIQQRYYSSTVSHHGIINQANKEILRVSIINTGRTERYVEKPIFKLDNKLPMGDILSINSLEDIPYPLLIKPGEKKFYSIPLRSLTEMIKFTKEISKVKTIIKDTHGKSFSSEWLKIA